MKNRTDQATYKDSVGLFFGTFSSKKMFEQHLEISDVYIYIYIYEEDRSWYNWITHVGLFICKFSS